MYLTEDAKPGNDAEITPKSFVVRIDSAGLRYLDQDQDAPQPKDHLWTVWQDKRTSNDAAIK